jgi:hypothetical protein
MNQPTRTFVECIEAEEQILLELGDTLEALRAFERELTSRVGASRFVIANSMVWEAMFAMRDLFVIRFASWVRSLAQQGGFFGQVQAHYLSELRRAWSAKFQPSGDPGRDAIKKLTLDGRRARLEERFPAAVARKRIDVADIEALRDEIWTKLEPVVNDRDSFRAHPHDGEQKANARLLRLDELEPLLEMAQALMNDLRLAADFSTLHYGRAAYPNDAPKDLVDLLLFHDIAGLMFKTGTNEALHRDTGMYWYQVREEFLAELQRRHAARPDLAMNDGDLNEETREALNATLRERGRVRERAARAFTSARVKVRRFTWGIRYRLRRFRRSAP